MLDALGSSITSGSELEEGGAFEASLPRKAQVPNEVRASIEDRVAFLAGRAGAVVSRGHASTSVSSPAVGGLCFAILREPEAFVVRFDRVHLRFTDAACALAHVEAALDGRLRLLIEHAGQQPVAWMLQRRDEASAWRTIADEYAVDWRFWERRITSTRQNG